MRTNMTQSRRVDALSRNGQFTSHFRSPIFLTNIRMPAISKILIELTFNLQLLGETLVLEITFVKLIKHFGIKCLSCRSSWKIILIWWLSFERIYACMNLYTTYESTTTHVLSIDCLKLMVPRCFLSCSPRMVPRWAIIEAGISQFSS